MINYIPDENKFGLAGPPKWFQLKLYEFDPSLVIVPSKQGFYYRIAQRRKLILPDRMVQDAMWHYSDTKMLAQYSLVPVTTILATVNWSNPLIFVELTNRAPWRLGGHEKVNKMLEEQDAKTDADKQQATDDHLEYLSKDAWKYYRKKIGLGRSWNTSPSTPTPKPQPRIPVKRELAGFSRSDQL